ncbi:hypothetical protein KSC_106620 [Ktedonobacter sp. SOSP1-52]|nr:hypothetical protein KSC_106620 [Ktedonobacter sp. SOSP1-52]
MQAALDHLQATGYPVQDSNLEHLSPITSAHIHLHGSHHLDLQALKKRRGQLSPLPGLVNSQREKCPVAER